MRVPGLVWLLGLLALVFLAAGPAGMADIYNPVLRQQPDLGYTVRFDLNEIADATRERDRADYEALLASAETPEDAMRPRFTLDDVDDVAPPRVELPGVPAESLAPRDPPRPAAQRPQPAPPPTVGGILAVDFDLGGGPSGPGAIQVEKAVRFAGQNLGRIGIRIDASSSIYVSKADVMRVLPETHRPDRALEGEYVPLSLLRTAGVNLRYDPSNDVMVLNE